MGLELPTSSNSSSLFHVMGIINNFTQKKMIVRNPKIGNVSKACFSLIAITLTLFVSCKHDNKQQQPSDLYTIDVELAVNEKKSVPISNVALDINYIPLETTPHILIGRVQQIEITESFIFIGERNCLQQFNREGRFIRQIGSVGRGPENYQSIMYFAVNEAANKILIQGEHSLNWYDLKGKYIRSHKEQKFTSKLLYFNPTRLACNRYADIENPTSLIIWNTNLEPICKFKSHNPPIKKKLKMSSGPLYSYENNIYFKENYNDTLYCIKNNSMIPYVVYKENKLLIDRDFDLHPGPDMQEIIKKAQNKLINNSIIESKIFVFSDYIKGLPFGSRDTRYTRVLFNKTEKKVVALSDPEMINDIDGGFSFWPTNNCQNNILIRHISAFDLKTHINSNNFKNSTPKYPEKKKALEKLANSLDENDNPVLMLVKLKE
ncbi:6-bladed beta-propeller [Draconibacterium mangrovi]|uniref:6-bladed beta-propeller n=1 Tax=Draconibacterium mangrovi TaxID=2697469 RepID=UPI0013D55C4C|nr:6-bladed beta-propeller [Draconibacterium mangrovi]